MDSEKTNRGRSDEARDPNRPIDPLTGEKEGLGPRDEEPLPEPEPTEEPADDEADDEAQPVGEA